MKLPEYMPTPTDIHWLKTVMEFTKIGGQIIYPRSGLVYEKTGKTSLKFLDQIPPGDPEYVLSDRIATKYVAAACDFEFEDINLT